jgi:hypothetical protein
MQRRVLTSIGIASVVAATAVPSALALRPVQEGGGALAGSSTATYDGYKSSYPLAHEASQQASSIRPDDKAGIRTSAPTSTVAVVSTDNGFDWADAGIGAGGALGLVLLTGLGVAVTHRGRKGPLAA